ncbi:MAG: nuclear transport factor 2 family protein [Azonexus sp.]|jgi:hypothetical protein|uniref:DUF6841 family protein n=1 Tax=Azonexus sp. TaxID=1872668 RepID=UPI0028352360|nr:hypothetical protein [Azonexus sp.]MDR0777508.1 nuclear transport factor 2 family protein [Azonexus sp.]
MPTEIRAFFDRYRDAFNALDGEAVAQLYAVPSGIVSAQQYTHWPVFEPIAENMAALCKLYADHGFRSASYEPSAFIQQGEHCAVSDLSWVIERTEGQEPWRFNTTYNLLRTPEGWRVLLCTAYEERRLNA